MSAAAFIVAVWQIRKTQSAAESAAQAAIEAREVVQRVTLVSAISQSTVHIDSLIYIVRERQWQRATERYAPLRKLLIDVEVHLPLEKKVDARDKLEHAVEQLVIMEDESNIAIANGTDIDVARFLSKLLEIQNNIYRVHAELEREMTDTS